MAQAIHAHLEWNGEAAAMANRIGRMRENLRAAVIELMNQYGGRIQQAAQEGAPWTDRTGHARGGLSTTVQPGGDVIKLILFHTATYGIWLEVRWGGKYRIIMPTLEAQFPALMAAIAALVR